MKRAESIQERQASVEGILIAKIYFFFKINHYYISFESIPVKIAFDSEKLMNTKFELPTFIFMQIWMILYGRPTKNTFSFWVKQENLSIQGIYLFFCYYFHLKYYFIISAISRLFWGYRFKCFFFCMFIISPFSCHSFNFNCKIFGYFGVCI